MDNDLFFKLLYLLTDKDYRSRFYTFIDKTKYKIKFTDPYGGIYYIADSSRKNSYFHARIWYEKEKISFIGNIGNISFIKELLESPCYTGCDIGTNTYSYYFRKFEKVYEFNVNAKGEIKAYCIEGSTPTLFEFDDLVRIILQTTNTKSAHVISELHTQD